jgi:hypothetical protein
MKIKSFFLAFLAGALALVSCQQQEELGPAKVTVTPETLSFGMDGGSQTVTLTATRDWVITTPEWMGVDIERGEGHSKPLTVALTASYNPGNDRTGSVVFSIGLAKAIVTVNQAGSLGPVVYGDGSKANPYTVEGVIQYLEELGADVTSPKKVYVMGKVSAVTEEFTTQYGNGTFNISDDGEASGAQFTAYRVKYLGNKKFASGDVQPKKGDEVILFGSVVNYKGNTPETAQNDAFLFSLNGVDKGGDDGGSGGGEGEAKGSGTLEDPYNPAGAAAYAASLGADVQSDKSIYIKGKISKVGTTFADSGNYGNATFNIVDVEDGTGDFYVYQTYYLGGKKWVAGNKDVAEGDIVIVYGPVVNYKGNTPETVGKGASYIYSHNGDTGGGDQPGGQGADPAGTGTLNDPFNVAAAIAKAVETGETATEQSYYIKGTVTGTADVSAQYKNATFDIKDPEGGDSFKVYRIKSFDGADFTGDEPIKAGDVVVVYGQIVNYKGNTPETAQGGRLISINGKTEFDPNGGGGGGGEGGDYSSTVTYTPGESAYAETATVNGQGGVPVLKLGTGSKTGSATITVPAGATKLTFYALSWKGKPSKLVFKMGGTTIGTVEPAANDGLSNKEPYTLTVTDADKYSIDIPAAAGAPRYSTAFAGAYFRRSAEGDREIEVSTEGDNTRAAIFGIRTDKDPGQGGGGPETPDYNNAPAKTVAEFIAAADENTYYKLTGKVSKFNANYCSMDLTDDSGTIYVYSVDNKADWSSKIKDGGTVTLAGKYKNYNGKDEVVNAQILDFKDGDTPDNPPSGEAKAVTVKEFLEAAESDSQKYQLTGTISNLASATYGNFDLVDDSGSVYVYGLTATELGYGAKNDKSFESLGLAEGDNITLIGYRGSYNGKDEVMYAYFVKKNAGGDTPDNPPAGDNGAGTLESPFNIAGAVDYINNGGTDNVYVKGKISAILYAFDATHETASFWISDDGKANGISEDKKTTTQPTKDFEAYGVKWLGNKQWAEGNSQPAVGDDVVIYGKLTKYKDTYETSNKNAYVYSWKGNTTDPNGGNGGDNPGGDNPGGDNPGGNEGGLFASNVEWTVDNSTSYSEKATVNGTADVSVLKLGTSSKYGTATLTLPEGTTSLTFYALSWKGQPTAVLFKLDGDDVAYVEPAANDGLSNKSPYTLTVTDNDKYTVTFPATNTIDVVTSGSNKRAGLFAIQAGNESGNGGGNGGGGGSGTVSPKKVTVAQFLAAEVSSTQPYQIKGVISNITNPNSGVFDITDETGTVHVNGLTDSNLGYGARNDNSFASLGLKATDTITIVGYRSSFNFQPQMDYGYFVAINASGTGGGSGSGSGSGGGTETVPGATGDGTSAATAFNVAGAINYINGGGTDNVYVKGKISAILYAFDTAHETGTFWISDDGTAYGVSDDKKKTTEPTKDFEAYGVKWLGNAQWAEGNSQPAVGDEVILYGKLTKYNTTYETSNKNAYVYSWKGNTTDPNAGTGGDQGGGGDVVSTVLNSSLTWTETTDATYGAGYVTTVSSTSFGYYKYNSTNATRAADSDHIRVYKNAAFDVTAPSGKTIKKIVLNCKSGYAPTAITYETGGGSASTSDLTITWTGSASRVVLSFGAQARFTQVEVTFE